MNRKNIFLAVAALLPAFFIGCFLITVPTLLITKKANLVEGSTISFALNSISFIVFGFAIYSEFLYLRIVKQNKFLGQTTKHKWYFLILYLNFLVIPIYWYKYIWKNTKDF